MTHDPYQEALDRLKASKRYASLCPETLENALKDAFRRYKKPKDAEKAARERLHGITGAFLAPEELRRAEDLLNRWTRGDEELLGKVLSLHASTRERLPLCAMDAIYARIFSYTGRPGSILDLACGFNPIYLGAHSLRVLGVDIQVDAGQAIRRWAEKNALPVRILTRDLTISPPPEGEFDLTLAMKLLPVLERQSPGAARRMLEAIPSRWVAVSFPTRTLSGRTIGMEEHYAQWFVQRMPESYTLEACFVEGSELIYILRR